MDTPDDSTSEDKTPKSQVDLTLTKNWEDIPAFRRRLVKKRASPSLCEVYCQQLFQIILLFNRAQPAGLMIRESVKNYLADFFPLRGGGFPPVPLSFFGHNDFPLGGGGVPPNSVKEKIR